MSGLNIGQAFEVVVLPKPTSDLQNDALWTTLAIKYRALRLQSLKEAPEAFASAYEVESQRGLDQTFDRLCNSKAAQFIAVESREQSIQRASEHYSLEEICDRRWLGMAVLLGPLVGSVSARADPMRALQAAEGNVNKATHTDAEISEPGLEKFAINGVFVELSTRGRGVGKALIDATLQSAKKRGAEGHCGVVVTVLVNVENNEARKLYEKSGFADVGEETYHQEPRALLGDSGVVEKVALRMQLAIDQ